MSRINKYSTFIKLDEDFMSDPKIMDLFDEFKEEGIGVYLIFLPIFNNYPEWCFKIFCDDLEKIRKRYFKMSQKKFERIFDFLVNIGLFESDGIMFWSNRRVRDLLAREEVREKRTKAGKTGSEIRWHSERNSK